MTEPVSPALERIAHWLEREALLGSDSAALVEGLAERLVEAGVPLSRMTALVDTLHPVHEGSVFRWVAGGAAETVTYGRDYDQASWQATTYYHLERHRLPAFRTRLHPDEEPELEALREFRDAGYRDYVVVVERFGSGSVGELDCIYSSWMTREAFSDEQVAMIRRLAPVLALALKCQGLQNIAGTIAETYLGRNAARRVLEGGILRGVASELEAVLWCSDLQNFTGLSETLPPAELIPFLNAYAGALVEAIAEAGGDVLKFMGDGILAIFPVEGDPAGACRSALAAEREARRKVTEVNGERAARGQCAADFYLGLHLGRVYFGNIGSEDRLDFTVIGPAVNEASRIASLCSSVRRPLLMSSRFAACLEKDGLPLASVGRFALRGVSEAQHLYTLA